MKSNIAEHNNSQEEVKLLLLNSGASFVGFADVSKQKIPDNSELDCAIVIGIAYDLGVVSKLDSDVDAFEKHLLDIRKRMNKLLEVCNQFLKENSFLSYIPSIAKNLPGLVGEFSHKMAAIKAGLGWIGKNSLLVSSQFGCGLRLATVLTNAPFIPGTPISLSKCGNCIKCVEACPYEAIKGANWYPGIERDKLLDAFLCSKKREEFISKLGYKHPCGLCIKACPIGKKHPIS